MSVRAAMLEDLPALEALMTAVEAHEPMLGERLLAQATLALVAPDSGGGALGAALVDERAGLGRVRVLVAPEARGRGAGRTLLAAAVAEARAQGWHKLTGECEVGDRAALRLAAGAGFEVEALLAGHRRRPDGTLADLLALGKLL
jgi:L-amino acid N-acyltransferase YncA